MTSTISGRGNLHQKAAGLLSPNYIDLLPYEIREMIAKEVARGETIEARDLLDPQRYGPLFVNKLMREYMLRAIAEHATVSFTSAARFQEYQPHRAIWGKRGASAPCRLFGQRSGQPLELVSFPQPLRAKNLLFRIEMAGDEKFTSKFQELSTFLDAILARSTRLEDQVDIGTSVESPCKRILLTKKPIYFAQLPGCTAQRWVLPWVINGINPRLTVTIEFHRSISWISRTRSGRSLITSPSSWQTRSTGRGCDEEVVHYAILEASNNIMAKAFAEKEREAAEKN